MLKLSFSTLIKLIGRLKSFSFSFRLNTCRRNLLWVLCNWKSSVLSPSPGFWTYLPTLKWSETLQFQLLRVQTSLSFFQLRAQALHLQTAIPVLPLHLVRCPLGLETTENTWWIKQTSLCFLYMLKSLNLLLCVRAHLSSSYSRSPGLWAPAGSGCAVAPTPESADDIPAKRGELHYTSHTQKTAAIQWHDWGDVRVHLLEVCLFHSCVSVLEVFALKLMVTSL